MGEEETEEGEVVAILTTREFTSLQGLEEVEDVQDIMETMDMMGQGKWIRWLFWKASCEIVGGKEQTERMDQMVKWSLWFTMMREMFSSKEIQCLIWR